MAPLIEKFLALAPQWNSKMQDATQVYDECALMILVSLLLVLVVMCVMTPFFYLWRRSYARHPEHKECIWCELEEKSEYPGVKEDESDSWGGFVYLYHAALTL
ncbi:hypothetical protein MYU51_015459 [Penicillium brevicompactum]|uniref:uncharacterized protein n=1 Tax=Penicillium brevicompactum TaxID=5074 RepID=UPI0025412466|nr:uncharacterized protein N7506_001131 [Penicillium brevicompactum]KAJ5347878.1 hypothetical protein N7506_001131 [Penicillium brevicompactum]